MFRKILCLVGFVVLLSSCGTESNNGEGTNDPCDPRQFPGTSKTACGWPCCACGIEESTLFTAYIPKVDNAPLHVVLDVKTRSDMGLTVCENGELVVRGPGGELSRRQLVTDTPTRICTPAFGVGGYRVDLYCPAYPTYIQYQATIVDSSGESLWP